MSYYLDPNKLTERLRKEWETHGGLIIAVDYDSTLIPYWNEEKGADFEPIRQLIRDCKLYDCTIIINTAAKEDRIEAIKEYLKEINIPWDYFNESPPYIKEIGKGSKVYANVYLDDRAGLHQVFTTLQLLLLERRYNAACGYISTGAKLV
jgi:hypothetical protein